MKQENENLKGEYHVTIRELFTQKIYRLPFAVAIVVHFSMRFCGINAIMYYSTALFEHASVGSVGPYATIGVGVILVIITLVSGTLMDRAGRRTLHLVGLFGTWLCARPAATSIAIVTNWMSNFAVGLIFPLLAENDKISNYSFVPFAVITTFAFLFLWKYMPETKQRTFEEITMNFRRSQ
ncbi:unnamed protein product [Rotaria magnacalcarata]|uniref:Uncharacterized protein n=1 Tax=Rotaria magnacalcarata TaxID=392030 RepID=A0A814VAH3_9BILA|nr:unnamed protein product [Rotaria magnacalcarata]CAF4706078.1 unnamed protein product [Rotaria magnacalcarata]CAF4879273.1 unnamed protein product [Rotaria magnacalcarata]